MENSVYAAGILQHRKFLFPIREGFGSCEADQQSAQKLSTALFVNGHKTQKKFSLTVNESETLSRFLK